MGYTVALKNVQKHSFLLAKTVLRDSFNGIKKLEKIEIPIDMGYSSDKEVKK